MSRQNESGLPSRAQITDSPSKHLQQIRQLLQKNKLAQAQALCQQVNQQFPNSAEAWVAASVIASRLKQTQTALELVDRALSLQPDSAKNLVAKATLLIGSHRISDALKLAEKAKGFSHGNAQTLDMVGTVFSRCDAHSRAKECYLAATQLAPNHPQLLYNLAASLRHLGEIEGSEKAWSRVIELQSEDYDAWYMRSDLRTQTAEHNHVAELQALLEEGIDPWLGRAKVLFALAKELEDLGDYDASFSWLKQGASLRRQHMPYSVDRDLDTINKIIDVFSETIGKQNTGSDCNEPIFIVGLPRTGTTLVDRILSSHSNVVSAGELNNFALLMTAQVQRRCVAKGSRAEPLDRMGLIEHSRKLDWSELGSEYLNSTQSYRQGDRRFIDKMPLNFLYLGLIHRALPKAKIIHVVRNPMDACYAMYKRLFKDAYPMSYDLDDLGRYYLAYRRLMQHWYKTLPGVIHTVSYEQLVTNQDQVSRQLVDACDLDWEDSCLSFENNEAATTTASASQVRQGVYRSSVGKWRCYEVQLQPLRELLEGDGVDIEHDEY